MNYDKIKILAIEDNPLDVRLIIEYLEECKSFYFDLTSSGTLTDGIKELADNQYDVILLDLNLPDSYGFETFEKLFAVSKNIPIILLTGIEDELLATNLIKNGAQDYLTKGQINNVLLVRTILYSIERKKTERRIAESEERYRLMVDEDLTGDFITSEDGKILLCNYAFAKIFGFNSIEEAMAHNASELYPDESARDLFKQKLTEAKKLLLYEERLKTIDGKNIDVIENIIGSFDAKGNLTEIKGYIFDNTKKKNAEKKGLLYSKILSILNRQNEWKKLIKDILSEIKQFTEIEAVAIRIKDGEDFPYYETDGFPEPFVEKERYLCQRNKKGEIVRDENGKPRLECMCGNIISRRYDSSKVFFTPGGSFWTNGTTELLASTTEAERKAETRNHCNKFGYESVALVPLKSGDEVIGLLQMNDKRTNRFDIDLINYFENIGSTVGIAYQRMRHEFSIKESEERFRSLYENSTIGIIRTDLNGKLLLANPAFVSMLGCNSLDEINRKHATNTLFTDSEHRLDFYNILKNEKTIYDYQSDLIKCDGDIITIQESGKLIEEKGNIFYDGIVIDITERKKAENLLNQSMDRFSTLLKIYEHESTIKEDFLDYALHQAINLTSSKIGYIYFYSEEKKEFVLNSWSDGVMEECKVADPKTCYELDKTGIWGEAVRQRKEILVNDFQESNVLKKGYPEGHLQITKFLTIPIFDDDKIVAVVGMANKQNDYDESDIMQLKLLMNSVWRILKRKEANAGNIKLSKAVEQSPITILITDLDSNIEYVNPKFTELTGYTKDEVIGKNPRILQSGHHNLDFYKEMYATLASGNDFKSEMLNKKKNGELFWESSLLSPIKNEKGDIINYIAIKEDITEKKKIIEELIISKQKSDESVRLKTEFLAQMSHEIRSPMNAIISFASILHEELDNYLTDEHIGFFKGIESAGGRLVRTVDLILNAAEMQVGSYEPTFSEFGIIGEVLDRVKSDYSTIIEKKGIIFNLASNCSEAVMTGDKYSVYQIFTNLVDNAVKYTKQGSININLEMIESENKIVVTVEDTGIGMSEEFMKNIYQPFSQEERGYSRRFEGNGLGLSLVKKYCDLNRISIEVESLKGAGTRFMLIINTKNKFNTKTP